MVLQKGGEKALGFKKPLFIPHGGSVYRRRGKGSQLQPGGGGKLLFFGTCQEKTTKNSSGDGAVTNHGGKARAEPITNGDGENISRGSRMRKTRLGGLAVGASALRKKAFNGPY